MEDLTRCGNCQSEVTADSDFCPHCGYLFEGSEAFFCAKHPGKDAIGVCIVCHQLVCQQCATEVDDRLFCTDHEDVFVEEEWGEVFTSSDVNEAEMAKAVLEASGLRVQTRDFGSIGYVWDGGGDSALSRSQLGKPARVFVPLPEFLHARQVLTDWKSAAPN